MAVPEELRRTVRVLVAHYGHARLDDYDTYMHAQSALWLLRGRDGLDPETQLERVQQAITDLSYLLDETPDDDNLVHALKGCEKMTALLDREITGQQLDASVDDDFARWDRELTG